MGISDIPLNKEGKKQASQTALYLQDYPVDIIVTSPLKRAVQTARAIQSYHPDTELVCIDNLRERSFGILEGLSYEDANARYPQIIFRTMWHYPNFRPPQGESLSDVAARAKAVIDQLLRKYAGRTVIVVSHGSFIRNFLSALLILPLEEINAYTFTNASLSVVRHSPMHGWQAHVINNNTLPTKG